MEEGPAWSVGPAQGEKHQAERKVSGYRPDYRCPEKPPNAWGLGSGRGGYRKVLWWIGRPHGSSVTTAVWAARSLLYSRGLSFPHIRQSTVCPGTSSGLSRIWVFTSLPNGEITFPLGMDYKCEGWNCCEGGGPLRAFLGWQM